jgi:hypothetical protein
MNFHFKISLMISKFDKSYDRCNTNAFKQLTLIKTWSLWNIFIMSLPPRYAIMLPLLKKARSTNTPRFLDYLVTWQSEFARVPPRAPEPLNTGTLGTRLSEIQRPMKIQYKGVWNSDKQHQSEAAWLGCLLVTKNAIDSHFFWGWLAVYFL